VAGALADGFGSHRHSANHRQGRRLSSRRQGRRGPNRAFRRGRTEDLEAAPPTYAAAAEPIDAYGAAAAEDSYAVETTTAPALYDDYPLEDAVPTYEAAAPLDAYGASDEALEDPNLAMLEKAVPGIPGEDYPINAEVPETAFSCEGQVDGGYYADPEAQCQVFHICTADGQGGLAKYSFLCPNGTIFNQNYFICDWWFNFDCSEAEGLYSLNDDIAAERAALAGDVTEAPTDAYGAAPTAYDYPVEDYPAEELPAYDEEVVPTYEAETEAPALDVYEAEAAAVLPTAIPTYEEQEREARRRFNGGRSGRNGRRNNGRRNGRRNNSNSRRQGRRQGGNRRQNSRRQGRNNRNFRG